MRNRFCFATWLESAAALWLALGWLAVSRAEAQPTLADVIGGNKSSEATQGVGVEPKQKEVPFDEYGRGTPRSSMEGFLTAASDRQWDRAVQYLDLRRRSKDAPPPEELARQLKVVLDRTLWVDLEELSDDPDGRAKDGLPASRDRVGRIELPSGAKVDILLQRVSGETGVPIWQISSATLARVPELYQEFGYHLEPYLPEVLFEVSFLSAPLIEWLTLLVFLAIGSVAAYGITGICNWLLRRRKTPVNRELARFITGPVRLLVGVGIFTLLARLSHTAIPVQSLINGLERAALVLAAAWTVLRLVDAFGASLSRRLLQRGEASLTGLISPARNIARFVIGVLAVVAMLSSFGFNVTALLAGLGVGGIAVALAAQRTLENMIGGFTLLANRPAQIGDFCRFGDKSGTIEEIGLYSTRIRSPERTVITVPNSEFSKLQIENLSRRDKILYRRTIALRCETTPEQIRYILVEIRKMLYAHPKVDPDPARVRFTGFGTHSLDLEIFAYITTADFGHFLEVAEDLNLRIMDIVAQAGSGLAFPAQTKPLDETRIKEVEATVQQWRARRELYLPAFPREKIDEIRGTIAYPPDGSPFARNGEVSG